MTSTHQAVRNKPFLQTGVEATVSFRLRGLSRTAILFSFVLVLLIGAAVRFMSYDRFLPFQDRTDESVYQVTSLHRRGVEPNAYVEVYYASQPPAYIWLTMMIQPFVEYGRPWTLLADYLHMQKLLAVLIGILTTAIIMRLGWLLGGNTAAFFAGLVWAFSSEIVDRNNQALPDPFVYLTVAASLVMVIHALRHESSHWLFGSLLMGIAAIYFKYTPWYILIPWGIVALILLRRRPRQMLPWLALQVLVGILCAWYLLVNYAALDLPNREVDTFRGEGLMMALTPWRNFNNLWSSIRPIGGEAIFLVIMPLGVLAYLYNRGRGGWLVDKRWYGILVIYCVVGLLMISSFTNVWEALPKYRHTMPVTIALLGLWSAAITQIIQAVIKLRDSRPAVKIWRWMPAALGVLVTLWIVVPHTFSNAQRIERYQRVSTHNLLWTWTDQNIPPDGRIMTRSHDALQSVWNRWWGGYDGKTPFDWWHENPIPQNTPEEYVERGIMYFAITDEDLRTGYSNANRAVKDFVEQLVHVKTIPAGAPDVRGPTIHFYRMVPPAVAANITFDGRITLIGYDTNAAHLTPEDTLAIRPYWRVTDVPRSNYSLFVHLYRQGDDQIITQYDGPPAQMQRPTLTWTDLDELYIGSEISLNLPETLEPGDYRLMMGLYDYLTGERLLLENGADAHAIEFSLASP